MSKTIAVRVKQTIDGPWYYGAHKKGDRAFYVLFSKINEIEELEKNDGDDREYYIWALNEKELKEFPERYKIVDDKNKHKKGRKVIRKEIPHEIWDERGSPI